MSERERGQGPDRDRPPHVSVVVPVYRSAAILPDLHQRLVAALEALGHAFEIIYVDDASPDDAWGTLVKLRGDDPRVVLLQLMRNSGQHRAVLCGLALARGEAVVTMDDDLQHPPEEIGVLYDALRAEDADVVIGRYDSNKHGRTRRLGTSLVKALAVHGLGIPRDLDLTSFRIMRRQVAQEISGQRRLNPVVGFMILSATPRVASVRVRHDPRSVGTSSYTRRALIDAFLVMLFDYTDWPMRAVGAAGALLSLGSLVAGAVTGLRWLAGAAPVSGSTALVLLLLLTSGTTLLALGVLGSYVLRIHRQSQGAHDAIVRRRVG